MSQDPIEQVREAERKAEALIGEAARQASHMKKDAEAKGRLAAEEAERKAKMAGDALIASAHERMGESFQKAAAELDEQTRALRLKAGERQAEAIEAILAAVN